MWKGFIMTFCRRCYFQHCNALHPWLQSGVRSTVSGPSLLPCPPPTRKAPSAASLVMPAMSKRGRSPPSAHSQASGAPHRLPAQVLMSMNGHRFFLLFWSDLFEKTSKQAFVLTN